MRISTFLSLITFVLIVALSACKQKSDSNTCPAMTPAADNLRFQLFDKKSGKNLLVDTTSGYHLDSITATQPCYGGDTARLKYVIYQVPKPGEALQGCCFWFPSLKNPAEYGNTDCFQVMLHWSNQDTDTLQWGYYTDQADPCKPQIMLPVSFNGTVLNGPAYDGAYQYYALTK